MMAVRGNPDYLHLIDFVRPSHHDRPLHQRSVPLGRSIGGAEARSFYEELCSEDRTANTEQSSRKRKCTSSSKQKVKREKQHQNSEKNVSINHTCDYNSLGRQNQSAAGYSLSLKSKEKVSGRQKQGSSSDVVVNQRVKDHRQAELFRLAQNGDEEGVKSLLQQGVDVNCVDHFGWTVSMSAAFEGHVEILRLLVRAGADLTVTNPQGLTALSLASQKRHAKVVEFIQTFHSQGMSCVEHREKPKQVVRFYCEVCKNEFSDMDQATHNRSTVHIFNTGAKPKDDSFLIPPSNIGFRLMLKSGWDGGRGLGPSGHGQKFPVKTFLKRDRKGLGNKVTNKAKITHFGAKDKAAVAGVHTHKRQENVRTLSRRAQKKKDKKDRMKEIELRRQLS